MARPLRDVECQEWTVSYTENALRRSLKGRVTPPNSRVFWLRETTLPWISERPLRRCGSRPAQHAAARASERDLSVARRLSRPRALQRSGAVPVERCDPRWPQCTNLA